MEVGEISGAGVGAERTRSGDGIYKGRKGFCFGIGKKIRRPGNASVMDLLSDERFTEAVLKFLKNTGAGKVKQEVLS